MIDIAPVMAFVAEFFTWLLDTNKITVLATAASALFVGAGDTTGRFKSIDFAVQPLGPGSSLTDARSAGTRERGRARFRTAARGAHLSNLTMSNSAVLFVPAARFGARGLSLSLHPPQRGAGGAPTGAHSLLSRLRGATVRAGEARRVP